MSSDKLEIKYQLNNKSGEKNITEKEVSQYVEARMQEIFSNDNKRNIKGRY